MQFPNGGLTEPERLFRLSPLRDIQRDAHIVGEMSCRGIAHRKTPIPDPPDRPIRPYDPVFLIKRDALSMLPKSGQDAPTVIRMDEIHEGLWVFVETRTGSSPDPLIGRADVQSLADGGVGRPDDLFYGFRNLTKTGFALLQRLLGPFPV